MKRINVIQAQGHDNLAIGPTIYLVRTQTAIS